MDKEEVSKYLKIIYELQKRGYGDSKDLENIKYKLVKDKGLEEAYLNYLTTSYSQVKSKPYSKTLSKNEERMDKTLVTTTETIQGKTIDEYLGIVSGHAVMGMGYFTDVIGGIRDVIGGRSKLLESHFFNARELALDEMITEAMEYGANAIVAVRFNDVSMEGKGRQMALVSVHGTAVKIS